MPASAVLGRVVATELRPATPHQFHFWTPLDAPVGIGAIVRVEGSGRTVYGLVTDGLAYSSAGSEARLFLAAVLRQAPY